MARYALDLVVSQARSDNYCRLYISCWYYPHWLVSKLRMWVVAQTLALRRLASSKLTGMDIEVTTARLRICGEQERAEPRLIRSEPAC
jgi:hypothetical protein